MVVGLPLNFGAEPNVRGQGRKSVRRLRAYAAEN